MSEFWNRGDVILQEGWTPLGKLIEVRPAIVVDDTPDCLSLYFPAPSTWLSGDWMNGRRRYDLSLEARIAEFSSTEPLELEERVNGAGHVLSLLPANATHACWFFWNLDWQPTDWYINMQAPYTRTDRSIRVVDCYLDLALEPSLAWRWKDEDEFAAMVDAGAIAPDFAARLRADADRMVTAIETRSWPYDRNRSNWRPDPSWPPLPHIKELWQRD